MTRRRILAVTAVAALALAGCGRTATEAEKPAARATGERLSVRRAVVADYKPVAATVTTRDMGDARARIGGTLVQLNVREGDQVRKGQVLAVVADQRIALETRAYGAQVAAASAEAGRAQADLARVRTLYEKGIYAKARLDQAEAAAKAAQATAQALEAQQAASAELGAQGAVLAPTNGRVLRADVPAGSVVTPGQSIVTVTAGEPLLRLEIPEAQAAGLTAGDAVQVDARDLPGVTGATIRQVYPAVAGGRVTADIAAPGLKADLVGRRVRVMIKVGERTAITVPRRFVASRYGVDYVRVVDRTGRPGEIAVQIAPGPDAERVEVLSGLGDGDVILAPEKAS